MNYLDGMLETVEAVYLKLDGIVKQVNTNESYKQDLDIILIDMLNMRIELISKMKEHKRENSTLDEMKTLIKETARLGERSSTEDTKVVLEALGLEGIGENINSLLELVNSNVKALSTSVYIKTQKHNKTGIESHRYIKDLDTAELVLKYVNSGSKLTKEIVDEYKERYNITYVGLMGRLQREGVWVGRIKKD